MLVLAATVSRPLIAAVLLKDYAMAKAQPGFQRYIGGLGTAFLVANAELEARKQIPLFCAPPKLSLNDESYGEILDRVLASADAKYGPDSPIEQILLHGLVQTFPCKERQLSSASSSPQATPPFETVRFASTVWDSRKRPDFRDSEGNEYVSTRGCRGELEISATELRFHDPTFCWQAQDFVARFTTIEWISYTRSSEAFETTIKLGSADWTATFTMPAMFPLNLLRQIAAVSPETRQHCIETAPRTLGGGSERVRKPVQCSEWLK